MAHIQKIHTQGFENLTLTFALPHETKPIRLPAIPAVHTALLPTMADDTWPVPDNNYRRAVLTRDPCFPLWMEFTVATGAVYVSSTAVPINVAGDDVSTDFYNLSYMGSCTIDGKIVDLDTRAVIAQLGGDKAFYVPKGSSFIMNVTGSNVAYRVELEYYSLGSWVTVSGYTNVDGVLHGLAGSSTWWSGVLGGPGATVPCGFVRATKITPIDTPGTPGSEVSMLMGWATGLSDTTLMTPTGSTLAMLPFCAPPEFKNSVIPYQNTRANSTAALFTNVTAALSKEGTVLAGRLKPGAVDFWNFSREDLNQVHPSYRYFGPLEKGLYTFTTPSRGIDTFVDQVSEGWAGNLKFPMFNLDTGLYNAIYFADLGSSGGVGTQLAVSQYTHLEFETTSSLFQLGVSSSSIESLHVAEVALLRFGHFHENPIHWAALVAAAKAAAKAVAPMLAPVVQHYGQAVVNKGVQWLKGQQGGDRQMPQVSPYTPKPKPKVIANKKKVKVKRNK